MAKLYFRYGAMNSGKSTALLQAAHNYEERGMSVVLIKPTIDSKGQKKIVARLGIGRNADIIADSKMDIRKQLLRRHKSRKIDCVLVDEAQFLQSRQINQLFEVTVLDDIPVLCYGLRTDFQTQLFPGSQRLLALAHDIEELKTICRCGKKAILVGRKINGRFIFEGTQIAIDGKQDVGYESLCGNCYFKESNGQS